MIKAIYLITNILNDKQYIGQTIHPDKRWWEHRNKAKAGKNMYPLHYAIRKYGEENFTFKILEWTENYDKREAELIQEYNTISPNGYNVIKDGHSPIMIGEDHPRNTLTNNEIDNIIKDLQENILSDRQIAKKNNTTDKIIADINHGITHKRDGISYPIRIKKGLQKLKNKDVEYIKERLRNSTDSYMDLCKKFNVSKGVIYHINTGKTFYNSNEKYPIRSAK